MRYSASLFAASAVSLLSLLSARPFEACAAPAVAGTVHPYFDDQGTLPWYCSLAAAQDAARSSGKLLFIEFGRRACCNCRVLVARVLPAPRVKARFSALCVGLAADCDEPDPRVEVVFQKAMPDASTLPFVAVVSPDLDFVTGWHGAMDVDGCALELDRVEAWQAKAVRRAVPGVKVAPVAKPPSASKDKTASIAPTAPKAANVAILPNPPKAAEPAARPGSTSVTAVPAMRPQQTDVTAPAAVGAQVAGNQAAALAASRALLDLAERASKRGDHVEVLRVEREALGLAIRVEPTRWAVVLAKADAWSDGVLAASAIAMLEGRTDDAEKQIQAVRRDASGRGASIDAERGLRALALWRSIEASSSAERLKAKAEARTTFRGTRWEALFAI